MVPRRAAIVGDRQSLKEIVQIVGNLQIKELEVECLDCFDTMIKSMIQKIMSDINVKIVISPDKVRGVQAFDD
jgi:hypothetical protein